MWERGLTPTHLLILLIIILVLFGAKRVPDIARSLGRSIGEFKRGRAEGEQAARDAEKAAKEATAKTEAEKKADADTKKPA